MDFANILDMQGINPRQVILLRHQPPEMAMRKILPWLAAENPLLFNAYQKIQKSRLGRSINRLGHAGHVASFIGHEAGKALFVGLYKVEDPQDLGPDGFWAFPECRQLKDLGMTVNPRGETPPSLVWLNLRPTDCLSQWKGRLILEWPPPERSWWRRAHNKSYPILAISEQSKLIPALPDWRELVLSRDMITALPTAWRAALAQWRGIYYIYDASDGMGYVGAAYGENNLLGRWVKYAENGDGGNRHMKGRDADNFQFSILERVSPDMPPEEVARIESSWKERLHTRFPEGLNGN